MQMENAPCQPSSRLLVKEPKMQRAKYRQAEQFSCSRLMPSELKSHQGLRYFPFRSSATSVDHFDYFILNLGFTLQLLPSPVRTLTILASCPLIISRVTSCCHEVPHLPLPLRCCCADCKRTTPPRTGCLGLPGASKLRKELQDTG